MTPDWASAMDHEKQTGPVRNSPASGTEGELAHNPAVDDLFRRHLRNVYRLLGKPVPEELFLSNITTREMPSS